MPGLQTCRIPDGVRVARQETAGGSAGWSRTAKPVDIVEVRDAQRIEGRVAGHALVYLGGVLEEGHGAALRLHLDADGLGGCERNPTVSKTALRNQEKL